MELLLHFWCLKNLPVPHIETLITSKFIVNSPLLALNISNKIGFISFGVSLQKLFGFWAVHFGPWSGQAGLQAGTSGGGPDHSGGPAELVFWLRFQPSAGFIRRAAEPSGPEAGTAGLTAELAGGLLPTAIFFPTYKYPSSSLNQPHFWASLSSIVDLQSLPSLLHSLHVY
jgi:hypothetical protein